jgi:WD40 repeat protein
MAAPAGANSTVTGRAASANTAGHADCVLTVVVSPDGRFVISGGGGANISDSTRVSDHGIRVWNVETGQLERILDGHQGERKRARRDTRWQAVDLVVGRRHSRRLGSRQRTEAACHPRGRRRRARRGAHPEGGRLVSASENGRITLWSVRWGTALRTMHGRHSSPRAVAVTPDGRFAVSGSVDKTVRVWNLATGRLVRTPRAQRDGGQSRAPAARGPHPLLCPTRIPSPSPPSPAAGAPPVRTDRSPQPAATRPPPAGFPRQRRGPGGSHLRVRVPFRPYIGSPGGCCCRTDHPASH